MLQFTQAWGFRVGHIDRNYILNEGEASGKHWTQGIWTNEEDFSSDMA